MCTVPYYPLQFYTAHHNLAFCPPVPPTIEIFCWLQTKKWGFSQKMKKEGQIQ